MLKKSWVLILLVLLFGCTTISEKAIDLSDTKSFTIHEVTIDKSISKDDLITKLKGKLDYNSSKTLDSKEDLKMLNDFVDGLKENDNGLSFPMAIHNVYELVLSNQNVKEKYFILDYDSDSVKPELIIVDQDTQSTRVFFGEVKELNLIKESLK